MVSMGPFGINFRLNLVWGAHVGGSFWARGVAWGGALGSRFGVLVGPWGLLWSPGVPAATKQR